MAIPLSFPQYNLESSQNVILAFWPQRCPLRLTTLAYSHEPFITYQTRVLDLLCALYRSQIAKPAHVTHLRGGRFDRIIGINLASSISSISEGVIHHVTRLHLGNGFNIGIPVSVFSSSVNLQDRDLILRIPRFDHTDVAVQTSILQALISSSPVLEMDHYDPGSDNPISPDALVGTEPQSHHCCHICKAGSHS